MIGGLEACVMYLNNQPASARAVPPTFPLPQLAPYCILH